VKHSKDLRQCREIGSRLHRERMRQGLSLRDCAVRLGLRPEDVLNIEAGNVYAFYRDEDRFFELVSAYDACLNGRLSFERRSSALLLESFVKNQVVLWMALAPLMIER
jgi:transcriptional regulator with XRE-family HTH domain